MFSNRIITNMYQFAEIGWGISPEIFNLGPLAVRWYSLLFALGIIISYQIMSKFFANEKKDLKDLDLLTVYVVIGTVLGARLGHCLFYHPGYYLSNPLEIIQIWKGGLASHGAAIGILLSLYCFIKKKPDFSFLWLIDRLVIVVPLAGCLIRIGNFFNSEIYGVPSDLPWAVVFERVDSIPRHPAQLYEAIAYLLIFLFLFFYYKKLEGKTKDGLFLGYFLVLLFGARFFLEFFKDLQAEVESGMTFHIGQWLSVPFVLAGIYIIYWAKSKKKKK